MELALFPFGYNDIRSYIRLRICDRIYSCAAKPSTPEHDMARLISVSDGTALHTCKVVESLGYNPDIGARVNVVLHDGMERKAVGGGQHGWRFWTPRDRVQPLIDHAEREAAAGRNI
jgi:hypothetical protein